jgi:hypothetical protein
VKCPLCEYEGRRDNVRRHFEKKHPNVDTRGGLV